MLRSIKFTQKIVFHSRIVLLNASNQRQFIQILKCGYTTQVDELQRQIEIEAQRGRDPFRLKENLCSAYIREKNVKKVEELTKNYIFGDFIHLGIINMHIDMGNIELALKHFDEIRKKRPAFRLTRPDAARLARAMFLEEREWSEIIRIFTENRQPQSQNENVGEIHLFLQTVADTGNPGELDELFDVLVANNFVVKDSHTAGFMVKVHLVNKDLAGAVHTFEKQFEERKFTSNNVPLMMALITANDMEKLGTVFKLVQLKFSDGDAVLSLVTSFIQLGNIDQARVLLDHNMSRISDQAFRKYCDRYYRYAEYSLLENLLAATAGLEYDRSRIYTHLLTHLCAENKTDEALRLWRQQREQDEDPSKEFLIGLESHLRANNVNVPFKLPEGASVLSSHLSPAQLKTIKMALRNGNVDAALEVWPKIKSNHTQYIYFASDLVQLLSKNKRFAEAIDISMQTIKANRRVPDVALRDLAEKLADVGDTQLLERLGESLPCATKRSIQFGAELLKAYVRNGKWDEFFRATLEKAGRNAQINDRIPTINLLALLQKQSIPLAEYEKFAGLAAEMGAYRPLNVLWAHYFLTDSPESNQLYDRFERDFPKKFEMAFLGSYLVELGDEDKLEELLEFIKTKNEKHLPVINIVTHVARMLK